MERAENTKGTVVRQCLNMTDASYLTSHTAVSYVEVRTRIHGLDAVHTRHSTLRFTRELQELQNTPKIVDDLRDAACVFRRLLRDKNMHGDLVG